MTESLLVLKATVLVVAALLLTRVGGRRVPAALRALVLTGTFAALLILPVATLVLPPLSVPIMPRLPGLFQIPTIVSDADSSVVDVGPESTSDAVSLADASPSDQQPRADASTIDVIVVARSVWLLGVLVLIVRLGTSLWTMRRFHQTGVPWPEGAALRRHLLGDGVAARTVIVLQPDVGAPVTYGLFRAVVALPPDAPQWPESDLHRALIHELEHVRRFDWATQCLAKAVCAVYWFHPLMWLTARRLRLAMEQACDDAVVRREEGTAYAEQLVVLARRLSAAPALGPLAMAAYSDLSQRVSAVLDRRRPRHGVSALAALSGSAVALGIGLVISPLEARSRDEVAADTRQVSRPRPSFEVAAVRPNTSPRSNGLGGGGTGGGSIGRRGRRFVVRNLMLSDIIRYAYRLEPYQAIEGSSGLLRARFDIEALIPDSQSTPDQSREMLQTLLVERFRLSIAWATREHSVYALVPARADRRLGAGLTPSAADCTVERPERSAAVTDRAMTGEELMRRMQPTCDMIYQPFRARIRAGGRTISDLAAFLSRLPEPGGLVVDRTGLAGTYDFDLEFAPVGATAAQDFVTSPPGEPHAPLTLALEEQLGLRLERTRGPAAVLVVEHVEMPGPN